MISTKGYKLIYDLFDSVIIFGSKDNIVFEGASLKKIFATLNIDIHAAGLGSSDKDSRLQLLKESLEKVKSYLEPVTLIFPNVSYEFVLFPVDFDFNPHIILTLKEKMVQIIKIEHDLKERVKELKCLYSVSNELESHQPLDQFIEKCVCHIQESFQFPADTIVNIDVGKKTFGKTDWSPKDIHSIFSSEITIDDKKVGEIRVLLKNAKEFLEEEEKLIQEVATKLAGAIKEAEKTINFEKQQKILLAKNEALLKLTDECNKRRQQLRTFFSAITDKIVVIDHNFEIMMSNKDEIGDSGKCYKKLFGLEQQCDKCPSVKTFETAENHSYEREVEDKFLLLRAYPIFDQNGAVDRVLEVCHDITFQKRMETQMLQSYKLASLGKLVAGVAHEINNPNTFILGNLKIIQESFQDIFPILEDYRAKSNDLKIARLDYEVFKENISTLVNDMINGANRTKKIVGDLRNFAKKDADTLADEIDLNYIIKNNLTLTSKHVKKYAELVIELVDKIPVFKGSFNKIEQVILNLVMNSVEAIENGNGIIKIKTGYDEKAKDVLLIVEDNGCGMDENTLKNIFDPFFTTKRNQGGTGLGLSITYGIIKDHNGKIEVESKPKAGTKFLIRFPIKTNI